MFERYKENYQFLRRQVDIEGKKFEEMPYEELLKPAEILSRSRVVDGIKVYFSAEAYNIKENGDIAFCIDAGAHLPTILGIKPSYQFFKRKDGSVYY